jgi:hypothetical protein
VPEPLRDDLGVDPGLKRQGRVGVPQGLERGGG